MTDTDRADETSSDAPRAAVEAVRERLAAAETDADAEGDGKPTLLLGTDFDGTLAPITDRPDEAAIRPESRDALRALRETDRVAVAVVSGRALDDVRDRVGVDGIDYAGNHGLEYRHDGETEIHPAARERVDTVQAVREALEEELAGVEGVQIEDKRVTLTVHHRHVAPEDVDRVRTTVEEVVERLGHEELRTTDGKAILEVRPAVEWDKGEALSLFADEHDGDVVPVFVGDDVSDEAGFRAAAPRGTGIRVGGEIDRETRAAASVESPAAVTEFFERLAETLRDDDTDTRNGSDDENGGGDRDADAAGRGADGVE